MEATESELPARIDRFEVAGIVGSGGMGTVFRAFDPRLQRPVAIKVLHDVAARSVAEGTTVDLRGPGGGGEQLLTEARALAQIAHPNVLAVYEIGTDRGRTFLVMELVDGQDLRGWLAERPRSTAEIRACFQQAAAGLAAAHGHRVIHRDFKPENVLVTRDGRVRVADFGLATLAAPATSMVRVGLAGAGTPAYMAPELRDQPATVRSDVYAFCVTLIEALLGARVPAADVERALAQRGLDRKLRSALVRGISHDPADRPSTIRELATALEPRSRRSAPWIAAGAGAIAVAIAATTLGTSARSTCGDSSAQLASRWNDARRTAVHAALGARRHAAPGELVRAIDDYAREWVRMRDETCAAELPAERRAARFSCLDRRLYELSATASAVVDAPTLERAQARIRNLPALAPCADSTRAPMPASPEQRAAIESITADFVRVHDRSQAGRITDADVEKAEQLERRAEATGDVELRVRIMRARALFVRDLGRRDEAEKLHLAAYQVASENGLDTAAIDAVIDAAKIAMARDKFEVADSYTELARGLIQRPDNANPRVRSRLSQVLGQIAAGRGDFAGARRHLAEARAAHAQTDTADNKDALALFELDDARIAERDGKYELALHHAARAEQLMREYAGPLHPTIADSLAITASANARLQRYAEARRAKQAQIDLYAQLLPADHPKLLGARTDLAVAAMREGDLEGGIRLYEEVLERNRRNPNAARGYPNAYFMLAGAHWDLGRRERAVELAQRAVDESERLYGAGHLDVALRLFLLADMAIVLGEYPRAKALLDRADPIVAVQRADHPERIRLAASRIELLRRQRDLAGAERQATRMLQLFEERQTPAADRERVWVAAGELRFTRRDLRGARELFEHVLVSREARRARALDVARAELDLGRVEHALGDRAGGLARIRKVRDELDRPTRSDDRAKLREWARANRVAL